MITLPGTVLGLGAALAGLVVAPLEALLGILVGAGGLLFIATGYRAATGREGLVGEVGEARDDVDPRGKVFLHGEIWDAESQQPIRSGEAVRVVQVRGMRLVVRRSDESASDGKPV